MGIAQNVQNSVKIGTSGVNAGFTILTNPFFWIILGLLFFPLDILNYVWLFIVNFIILAANFVLFLIGLVIFGIFAIGVALVNGVIGLFNQLSFTIPMPSPFSNITINLPNLPLFTMPSFPTFGTIPYRVIDDVRIFDPSKILFIMILEFFNINLPI